MAKTVSLINMKGGVGKSTLAVNFAWAFAMAPWGKRVLVIDLDPQSNASQYLLGPHSYIQLIRARHPTVWHILEQDTPTPHRPNQPFDVRRAIHHRASPGEGRLDLIPSQLELALSLRTHTQDKEQLLARTIDPIKPEYDLILIDCAPTESLLTTAAYLCSDYLLVPVRPEFLSAVGLPMLVDSMHEFQRKYPAAALQLAGVVFNATDEYAPEEQLSKSDVQQIAAQYGWYVFASEVTKSRSYPKGARLGRPISLTPHSRYNQVARMSRVVGELAQRIQL